jgi:hypothetical protein
MSFPRQINHDIETLKKAICDKLDREKEKLINMELLILANIITPIVEKKIDNLNDNIKENLTITNNKEKSDGDI